MGAGASTGVGKVDSTVALKLLLLQQQNSQKSYQTRLKQLQAQASKLKGKKDALSRASFNRVNKLIGDTQHNLNAITKTVAGTQNKYYEATGQYDKLLSGTNRDAYMALDALFKNYGLESLAGKIYEYVKNGYSGDTVALLLQDTPEYKQRFAGNAARLKAGLPVLSPADYINTENSYRDIMRQSGLPVGFYDSTSDFTDWISKDVSPTELKSRVDLATQATALANPDYKQALHQMGIDDGHMAAYFLDPNASLPLLQKAAATAQIGAEALHQGLAFDTTYAQNLATAGITASQAQQGYQQIAGELDTMKALGAQYGEQWNQRTSEQATFEGNAQATSEKGRLLSRERGAFGGATGGARAGLGQEGGAR